MAVYEIKYVREKVSNRPDVIITGPGMAVNYLQEFCFNEADLWREKCFIILLNKRNTAIGHAHIGTGGTSNVPFDTNLIARTAIDSFANGVIIAHNHPSGNPMPTDFDIKETEKVKKTLAAIGVQFIDHIILGENTFFSYDQDMEMTYPTTKRN